MKCIFRLVALVLVAIGLLSPRASAQIARDTINAATAWHTIKIDSVMVTSGAAPAMRGDSMYHADTRTGGGVPVVQLQINVASSKGRTDTIIVSKLERVLWDDTRGTWDSLWVPVPIMTLSTAAVDTLGVVGRGPYGSAAGGSYAVESFLCYEIAMDGKPWRVERRSGTAHPTYPDDSCTHALVLTYDRRISYTGGR